MAYSGVYTLVATEVLQTLHPKATGLGFYYKDLVGDIENALASNRQHACCSEGIMHRVN